MKSFTNFVIFFILLIAGIGFFTFIALDISEITQYIKAIDEIKKASHLSMITHYTCTAVGTPAGVFSLSVFISN